MHFLLFSLALCAADLKIGSDAPQITFVDQNGVSQNLAALRQKGPVALAFYPKAFTGGCTKELQIFSRRMATLRAKGVQVVAISGDDAETLQRFQKELHAEFIFAPDPDAKLMEIYGVRAWPMKIAKRTTFIVDKAGKIVRIDRGDDAVRADDAADFLLKM